MASGPGGQHQQQQFQGGYPHPGQDPHNLEPGMGPSGGMQLAHNTE